MNIPKHIAIIMDGNGRWAKKRLLPRVAGHARGVKRVKEIVEYSSELGIKYLTLFAFGRENWKRPHAEVSFLMGLLLEHLDKEFVRLHEEDVKIRFIGDRLRLEQIICDKIDFIEKLTLNNKKLNLNIAVDYSGSYDIIQAVNAIIAEGKHKNVTEKLLEKHLLTYPDPTPDLFIRTSGEMRLSNFMLWQMAYTEMYFTSKLWPDFNKKALDDAIHWFQTRERRYGMISEQL
ncbi:MAG TPA: polyprenyl diphosphate synthase [Aquella sp.]|nr:polyprenyl diphosphate synthase [Aquella sp.]